MNEPRVALTLFYVADLARAVEFYDRSFGLEKTVEVPVYVEYRLGAGVRFGLMPQGNTRHFLGQELGGRTPTDGCPRAELYLWVPNVDDAAAALERAGARCTSPAAERDWGDRAAYFLDLDGYVVAVAEAVERGAGE